MSNTPESPAAPKPKKKSKLLLIIIVAVIAILGGGGFFVYQKVFASSADAKKSSSDKADGDSSEEETEADGESSSEESSSDSIEGAVPDDEEVKSIVALDPFIVNLSDNGDPHYLRLSVSLGIGESEGGEEGKPSPLLITRARNAMLSVLTTKSSSEILTPAGKAKLRKDLLRAARAASEEPKVEAIYITDFIVQL